MTEAYNGPAVPRADYPFLFSDQLPPDFEQAYAQNRRYIEALLPWPPEAERSEYEERAIETCARALAEADYQFGRDTGGLGANRDLVQDGI